MRVALVHRSFNLDGSLERDATLAARGLAAQGVELHCYCDPATSLPELPGATLHPVPALVRSRSRMGRPAETLSFAIRATHAIRQDRARYDIVDVRGIASWEYDVVTVHGVTTAMQRRWPSEAGATFRASRFRSRVAPLTHPQVAVARAVERLQFSTPRKRLVIAVTEEVCDDLVDVHGVPRKDITVIPPPIDLAAFQRPRNVELRRELGLSEQAFVSVFVGHDFERKGLYDAIDALAGLGAQHHLIVVGRDAPQPFLRRAEAAGFAGQLHFVGPTSDPAVYVSAADLFVLPTRQDPWGIPLIEAMAAGVAVVTSEAAGAAAVVQTEGAGTVVPPGDVRALRGAIARYAGDASLRAAAGERGRRAAVRFGAEAHSERILASYERALADRRSDTGRPRPSSRDSRRSSGTPPTFTRRRRRDESRA